MAGNLTAMIAAAFSGGGAPPVVTDPYFDYTTLLLPGNGTNGAQNNTFLDSSTNNFTITRNGNTTQGTFSPFSQTGWSNYFDGSADYLTYGSNAAFTFGTGDFTVEAWVYITASASFSIFNVGGASTGSYSLYWWAPTQKFESVRYGDVGGATTNTYSINQWMHIAAVRSSGTSKLYINGVEDTGATYAMGNCSMSSAESGRIWQGSAVNNGYISNLRVVKGVAVYTANFTPPTAPLTAISGTSLLTCQSNRFIDNSSNNFTVTPNGNTSVQAFSPFNPSASWSAATYGGSGYFDGSGDYLNGPNNAAFDFAAGDFTIEAFVYPTTASQLAFVARTETAGFVGFICSTTNFLASTTGSSWDVSITFTNALTANAWNHIAVVRNGNVYTAYKNGDANGTTTVSGTILSGSAALVVGRRSGQTDFSGYMSSLRLVKGTAVYTSAFTPPTAPLTAITNTSLLLNFTNAGIYDATSKNDLETVGNAQISTAQSKWGGSSMYFDGTGDYLVTKSSDLLTLGTGNFTVEFWVRYASATAYTTVIISRWFVEFSNTRGFLFYDGITGYTRAYTVALNQWYHVAVSRNGTSLRFFVDGTQLGATETNSANITSDPTLEVGRGQGGLYLVDGYLQDLRITKGYARYTANFTPPTAAFPTL